MNKKRMSERKSQLRLNIQDFCMALPQNTDPVVGYLLTILQWEASLDVETNSILHKAFVNQIEQIKCKLKMELKLSRNKSQGVDSHNNNITKFIGEFHKLKQVFAYCLILSKKQSDLYLEVQKFNQYIPQHINLTEQLQNYLNEPIVFQTIFHNYLRIYNINILTADLINFLFAQTQQKTYLNGFEEEQQPSLKWTNPDIELLKNQKIIFKQLIDINRKYVQLSEKLKNSYIYYLSNDPLGIEELNANLEDDIKGQQQNLLRQKIKKLQQILGKVKKQPRLYNNQRSSLIIMESQPISNLNTLGIINQNKCGKVLQENKQFFIQTLYGKLQCQTFIGDQQFTFMKQKIIKVETLFFLNRILSAMNVISHIYNQLDLQICKTYEFKFKNLRKMIGSEFISDQIYQCKLSKSGYRNSVITNDVSNMFYCVVDMQNNKILYPSAVNYFYGLAKSMLSINFHNTQGLLQILRAKSQYMQILADTLANIFQLIKTKQLSCYKLLRQYIQIIIKSSPWNNLNGWNFEEIVSAVSKQKYKIGLISQIIYQFDHNYSIKEPLQALVQIQFQGLTKNCMNVSQIYKKILYQIIQIRNGLKIDHYYSINQIHQKFSLLPTDFDSMQNQKEKKQQLYFEDIIHEICTASHENLYLPKLFFLLDLQLKFKRIIFKLQLCWAYNKQVMFDKKAQAFKEFVDTHCAPIFQIVKKCQSMIQILQKIQQVQKYIQIFNKEVTRFHLIQKIVAIAQHGKQNISISIREQVNRFPLQKLQELNTLVSIFNPIESQKAQSKTEFLRQFTKNIMAYSSYKADNDKRLDPIFIKRKQKLASIIVIHNMISMRNTSQDYLSYIFLRFNTKYSYDIYQLKQNKNILQQYQSWLKSENLDTLIKYNQDLLVLSVLRTIKQIQVQFSQQSQDSLKLLSLIDKFELSKIFTTLRNINQIQVWRSQFGVMTKYHQIYQLMFHFDQFDSKVFEKSIKKLKYKQNKSLNLLDNKFGFNYQASDFISKLFSVYQINPLIRTKLQKNILCLQNQVSCQEPLYNKSTLYLQKLKYKIYEMFCVQVQKVVNKSDLKDQINFKFVVSKLPSQHIDNLKKIMLKLVANEYTSQNKQQYYGKFREIQMFKQKKGYQLPIYQVKQNKQYKIGSKKYGDRLKKAVISPHKLQEQQTKPLQQLKRRFKIQMLKKSIQIRKQISQLQLRQNKIRDQIVWETSKLQHTVIQKIKQFINLSNVDQQQSYINFKHTVNLQTIKGIQNVIDEQTSMFMERKNSEVDQVNGFVTQVKPKDEKNLNRKGSLLETNVDSILQHMQKIRIFSAWKKTMKKADLIKKQWCNFNVNVQGILNNRKILQSLVLIQEDRNNYLRQNVTCQIIKEENIKINQRIQQLKIDNLQRKVKNYKENLLNS